MTHAEQRVFHCPVAGGIRSGRLSWRLSVPDVDGIQQHVLSKLAIARLFARLFG
jgi:hypothetical protein